MIKRFLFISVQFFDEKKLMTSAKCFSDESKKENWRLFNLKENVLNKYKGGKNNKVSCVLGNLNSCTFTPGRRAGRN